MTIIKLSDYRKTKIVFDTALALCLLFVLLPFLVIISGIVIIETRSLPVFSQLRGISLDKPLFKIYKFRTLKLKEVKSSSRSVLNKSDLIEQVTLSGRVLRKTGLDELPQLINIVLGDMSFIGPRPLTIDDLLIMKETTPGYYSRRININSRPGISGFWQIFGKRELGVKNLIESEEIYENKISLSFDLFLFFMTIPIILLGRHYDSILPEKKKKYAGLVKISEHEKEQLIF